MGKPLELFVPEWKLSQRLEQLMFPIQDGVPLLLDRDGKLNKKRCSKIPPFIFVWKAFLS